MRFQERQRAGFETMKRNMKRIAVLLLAAVLLAGCGGKTPEPAEESVTAAAGQGEITEPTAAEVPTEPETSPAEAEKASAGGTLSFYIDGFEFHAGGPVSDILAIGVRTDIDLGEVIQPGHISGNVCTRVEREGVSAEDEVIFFFHAINTGSEPKALSECTVYSVIVNLQEGIAFGDGDKTFVSGVSTMAELTGVWGEPDYYRTNSRPYEEMAYYSPFDYVYFSFRDGVVRQIMTVYSADLHGYLAEDMPELPEGYFGNDAYLLLSRYLDITPYLSEGDNQSVSTPGLEERITLGAMEITFGSRVWELPERFSEPFRGVEYVLDLNHYVRCGKGNAEEFYILNADREVKSQISYGQVIGVITRNANYRNWGSDYSDFLEFEYQGLTNGSDIEDVLETFGLPESIHATSSPHACFVWLHYRDQSGNELRIRVDPMTGELAELRVLKYCPGAKMYS